MRITLLISVLLSVVAVVFALQNPEQIDINVGPYILTGSTALVIIVTFGIGLLVGILAAFPSRLRHRREVKRLRKQVHTDATGTTTTYTSSYDTDDPLATDPTLRP